MLARDIIRIGARMGAACALFSILVWGQPALTTISDVRLKADGNRFDGLAQITWFSFDSATGASIAQQSTTVRIIDGNLFVQLTPTSNATPLAQYLVLYESDGKIQFQETWNVTPSPTPLRIVDVRTSQPLFPISGGGGAGGLTAIQESDVTGLVADLTARSVKGPGFSNSRTAIISDVGQIEGAVGASTDCIHVDGTSGACGTPAFGAVTPGTNTGALSIGTGGSLAPTGAGTITPSVGTGLIISANAAAVDTSYFNTHYARVDAASTYGPSLQDFSLATLTLPTAAGALPTLLATPQFDSSTGLFKFGDGSVTRTVVTTDNTQSLTAKTFDTSATGNVFKFFQTNAKTSTYQVMASDFASCKTIPVASGTFTITLVAFGTQPADGQCIRILNYGSGVVTVARSGQNINGAAANLTLAAGSASAPAGLLVTSDATNYFAQPLMASSGGGMSIGGTVASGTSQSVPYIDGSGNLAQDISASGKALTWDTTNQLLRAGNLTGGTTPAAQIGQYPGVGTAGALRIAGVNVIYGSGTDTTVAAGGGGNLILQGSASGKLTVGVFGHLTSSEGAPPSVSACGTGASIVGSSTDAVGTAAEGTGATGCTVTFAALYATAPTCIVSFRSGLSASYSTSTTALTITNIGALSSTSFDYFCSGS